MNDQSLIFGGWGCDADFLRAFFGSSHIYIDVNLLMPLVVNEGILFADWADRIGGVVRAVCPGNPLPMLAWSTGAIVAFALLEHLRPPRATLIAATPSFCARPGFPYAEDPRAVRAMKRRLLHDRDAALRSFYERCGITDPASVRCAHSTATLAAGLDFLEQASLLPVGKSLVPLTFIHGNHDRVIPPAAGEWFARRTGGTFILRDSGHAVFA